MKEKEEDEENKIRKFAYKQRTDNQTNREQSMNSKTEATLILCGSSGERANWPCPTLFSVLTMPL